MEVIENGLPYLKGNPKAIFFTDFDGTITLEDLCEVDNFGFGRDRRRALELEVLKGNMAFRDAFHTMIQSVQIPLTECLRLVQDNIKLDPHFLDFYHWAKRCNIPIVVLSSGMTPFIITLLESVLGTKPENIFVVANDVEPYSCEDETKEDGWRIKYRDGSAFGHDKSLEIKPYIGLPGENCPVLFYAGDGVSDLSAASQTDILFAKEGLDLVDHCKQKGIPFVPFDNWGSILDKMPHMLCL
ncbi:putative phosphoserine phosphatase [Aspergillus bertholletiae]|uniref:Putative phosphoserine phosphatase n=1 Tax=Aspergillus bertholletiae TaxID=1226010 RepID=A0A5N7BKV7_9EURO|nr:putative phosphoserine phosphatase [Aspergillus bertholletiae]